MPDLQTTYMGLSLRNPIIVGSCSLTKDTESVKACADAGVGAVCLKSIFEEQIREDFVDMGDTIENTTYHPQAYDYFRADLAARYGAHEYCKQIEAMRNAVDIPVIASLNCFSDAAWNTYAKEIEGAGASALEINVSFPPLARLDEDPAEYLKEMGSVVQKIKQAISIPVTVKIPSAGLFVHAIARQFETAGADGLVCFNRFLVPTIDIDSLKIKDDINYSNSSENSVTRRYIALLANRVSLDLVAAGGIHDAHDIISMLLVGASAVQAVSLFYTKGLDTTKVLLDELAAWMRAHEFDSIDAFRGMLAPKPEERDTPFGRFQYIRTLTSII